MVFKASMDDRKRKQALETTHCSFRKRKKASVAFFGPVNEGVHYFPEFVSFPRAQNHEKCFAHDHVPNVHTKSELSQVHTKCLQLYSDCERYINVTLRTG